MKIILSHALLVCALSICGACCGPAQAATATRNSAAAEEPTDRFIVKWRSALTSDPALTSDATRASVSRQLGTKFAARLRQMRHMDDRTEVVHIDASDREDTLRQVLESLRADPDVEYAVPDRRRHPQAVPNDPLFPDQWFLQDAEPSATHATSAWDVTTGDPSVIVAVLDTGVRFEHPDLQGKLLPGYDFIGADNNGVFPTANDGDGRDSDASDPGDWINAADQQSAHFRKCPVQDSSWHGTRVSGIIAAATDNATGVAGIGWNTRILPVRVLGKCGGYDSDIIDGMRWAAGIRVRGVPDNPNPARIINLSLGGKGACSAAYAEVVAELVARDVVIVASAGNAGGPVDEPANCSGVLGVAGLRQAGTKVGYSNLGPEIGIAAPAGNCVNATGACLFSLNTTTNRGITVPTASSYTDQITTDIGTSFSAPIIAGIAALMRAVNPALSAPGVIGRMQAASAIFPSRSTDTGISAACRPEPQGSPAVQNGECVCTSQTCGVGMADAAGAVDEALRPAAIIQSTTTANGRTVTLSAIDSSAAAGHAIVAYAWSTSVSTRTVSSSATATVNIPTGQSVVARLTVTDDAGRSDSTALTLNGVPAAPTATSTGHGGGGLSLQFLLALLLLGVSSRVCRREPGP